MNDAFEAPPDAAAVRSARTPSAVGARRALRTLPALAYALGIFYGGVIDIGPLPEEIGVPSDKLLHFAAFGGFEWLLELAFAELPPRSRTVLAVAAAVGVGVALELVQAALPHRSAELLDCVADTLGALLGALILNLVLRRASALRARRS
jgi:VanZ family protein